MISYNWANKTIVTKIVASLKERGYRVWIDDDQMKGSILEASTLCSFIFGYYSQVIAVAGAVEQSAVVLMCYCQKYKDSPNCRLEGEYTISKKIDFIPIQMQSGYKADGWYD